MANSLKAYLAQAIDPNRLIFASSGGVFGLLAEYVLDSGGWVVGASLSDSITVEHRIARNRAELVPLLKSKYVRSDISKVVADVKFALAKGLKVLFVGTPCQIKFIKKSCEGLTGLLTCDLFCHGAPAQEYFIKWISEIERAFNAKVVSYDWRCKEHGWSPLETKITLEDGRVAYKKMDPYMFAFLNDISIPKSCGKCAFARPDREGDFSLGDAWGLVHQWMGEKKNAGLSLLLVNSHIAEEILEKIEGLKLQEILLSKALSSQNVLIKGMGVHREHDFFVAEFKKSGSFYHAIQSVIEKEQKMAGDKIKRLKLSFAGIRLLCICFPFSRSLRIKKKEIKAYINYLKVVKSFAWSKNNLPIRFNMSTEKE